MTRAGAAVALTLLLLLSEVAALATAQTPPPPPSSATAPPPVAEPPSRAACDVREWTWESQTVACAIAGAARPRRFTFKANFAGSHDDTLVLMQPTIDGQPATCENGGKLRSTGEDGEVSLDCTLALAAGGGPGRSLEVRIRWSHAQYLGFDVDER